MNIHIKHKKELLNVVKALLEFAEGEKKFLLQAEMGAGKTTFTKVFAAHLGVTDHTGSPTFSLVNEYYYLDDAQKRHTMRHLDLYRLRNLQEAMDIGIEDFLYDECYTFIEWPEMIEPILPETFVVIRIEVLENMERVFMFEKRNLN
jgi:tRNA threonylcarbamoyladenosine biosynthesis protein TsaE